MKNIYFSILYLILAGTSIQANAQNCSTLQATFQTYESRCTATGAIKIQATGGSGSYKYRAVGPVNVNFTSADSITGLASGSYSVEVIDIVTNCKITRHNVVVPGNYSDPRFLLQTQSVSCDNGSNGTITVELLENGRAPFSFSIVAPSPMGVGTTNSTGIFSGLTAGDYSIRLMDSCGGIQTRTISVRNYTWRIDAHSFVKFACDSARGWLRVIDSRGNVSTVTGIPGMQYGILVDGADTVWSSEPNFLFKVGPETKSVTAFARDACGNTKHISNKIFLTPSLNPNVSISARQCSTFTASVSGITNFFNPQFCLYDNDGNQLDCNITGSFSGLAYGSYCIRATDACSDTVISRCFVVNQPVPSVGQNVLTNNKTCETFDVAVTAVVNLTNPEFCLYNSENVLLECNNTGKFISIPYGTYCIRTRDECTGQVFTNCFVSGPPQPQVPEQIPPSYVTCENFGLSVTGDSLYNPVFCLRDTFGNIIACNSTGIFDSIPLGSYCVTIYDECRDTTIQRCMTVGPPTPVNDMVINEEDRSCSTFTAHVSTSLYSGNEFFLYDSEDQLIGSNYTGIFPGLPYGSYCIKTKPDCPDTLLVSCITALVPVPQVGALIRTSQRTCSTFTASVIGQQNLTDPIYYLTDSEGDTLSNNTTGVFNDLPFGKYCILVKDQCFDTTLTICDSIAAVPFKVTAIASRSCNYGTSKFTLSANTYPVTFFVYSPSDILVYSDIVTKVTEVDGFPDLPDGEQYKIVAEDACGQKDSTTLSPVISWFRHAGSVTQKCPGAEWANGSGNVNATATTNTGVITVRVIAKDGNPLSPYLVPNLIQQDSIYVFQDLGPGTYVVRYNSNDGCNQYFYDTIYVRPYQYPNLSRSSAYQCDVNGFSVGAVVTNGVGPFTYEIIGSTPSLPSIVAGPQSDPVFTINNGYNYSLIRLRALDACGNATLGDASILPLASSGIKVSQNCIGLESILSVDSIAGAQINWYYKENKSDPDSTLIGTGFQISVDPLTPGLLGFYSATITLNNGCITRWYEFHLNGDCHPIVPVVQLEFTGRYADTKVALNWSVRNDLNLQRIVVERKAGDNFEAIGTVDASGYISPGQYRYFDENPLTHNYYRLKLQFEGGKEMYSKIIYLNAPAKALVKVFPNPASELIHIQLNEIPSGSWQVELINSISQKSVLKKMVTGSSYTISRTSSMASGMYLLILTDLKTGNVSRERIVLVNRK